MKKNVCILLFILPAIIALGQLNYNDSREDLLASIQQSQKYRAHIVASQVTSIKTFVYKHNDSTYSQHYESRYDNRGNNTDWLMYKKGKTIWHNLYSHDDSNHLTEFASYHGSGKLRRMDIYTYNKAGNLIEHDFFKKDPQKLNSKTVTKYDNLNNIMETKISDRNGKLKSRIEYTYYEDGSKKQTIQYSGSGKVERIWNFDCNPVGTAEAKKFKDTNKICIHYETDKDGNPIKVKEEYMGGGFLERTVREVSKYDKNDNKIDDSFYYLNGKLSVHWSASYDLAGKMTGYILYKTGTQIAKYKYIYTYTSEGNLKQSILYDKSQVPVYTKKYVYTSSIASPAKAK